MGYRCSLPPAVAMLCLVVASAARGDAPASLRKLSVYPITVNLDGPRAEQRLGVLAEFKDGNSRDLSRDALFTVEDPRVAAVDKFGTVRGVADGETSVTVRAAGQAVKI